MDTIGPFPAILTEYGKSGKARDNQHANALRKFVGDHDLDDLVVISHGWRNNAAEATALYSGICGHLGDLLAAGTKPAQAMAGRKIGVMGVLWPSKPYRETDDFGEDVGGAASASSTDIDPLLVLEDLTDALSDEVPDADLEELAARARLAIDDSGAFPSFFDALRETLAKFDDADEAALEEGDQAAFSPEADGRTVQTQLESFLRSSTNLSDADMQRGGAAGGVVDGARGTVGMLLNFSTFYTMKKRAGKVGKNGVAETLKGVRGVKSDLRIHLVGHSFGARVLTMATHAIAGTPEAKPDSLSLLQAAFSQNSFSHRFPPDFTPGFFHPVVGQDWVSGPILVTHTHNDRAVTVAYSIASMISGQNAAALGAGEPSQYGGLGANGALHTSEAHKGRLLPTNDPAGYVFKATEIHNLLSDDFIACHSCVDIPEVAFAILSAMAP